MAVDVPDLWSKVDLTVRTAERVDSTATSNYEAMAKRSRGLRRYRRFADSVGAVIWIFAIIRVFIFDIDHAVVDATDKSFGWIVDYRAAVFVTLFAALLVTLKRQTLWVLPYILFFPLVASFWKLPHFIYRHKSWLVLLNILNILSSAFQGIKFRAIVAAVLLPAGLIILTAGSRVLLLVATVAVATAMLLILYRSIRSSLRPARFIELQRILLDKLLTSSFARELMKLDDELKNDEIVKYDSDQLNKFVTKVSTGVTATRALYYWAYQLDSYRKDPSGLVLNVISYVWLFSGFVTMFTFVNLGIYRTSPSQFQVVGDAGFLQMMHYSLSAFALNGVEGVNPVGPWALTLKIAIGFTGVVLFATLLLNLLIAARHIRQDDALRKVADDARRLGADLEVELRREYHVDIDEAARRLEGMGRTLVVVANEYMQRRIPAPSVSGEE